MIDILIPDFIEQYDLSRPPSRSNPGGGLGVKYARVEEVLSRRYKVRRVSSLEAVRSDFVIVEPLWFEWGEVGWEKRWGDFLGHAFDRVLVFGSDQTLFRCPQYLREGILQNVDWVTHNCDYQRNMFAVGGIYDSLFLCDPVPEHVFYPAQKARRVYASGQISSEKRTGDLIELFGYLQGSSIETCYIGSASTWGDKENPFAVANRAQLARELEAVTDVFLGNVSQAEAAFWSNSSLFHMHVAQYDCSCQNQQEAALSGAVLWGLTHPINAERPVQQFSCVASCAEAIERMDAESVQRCSADIVEVARSLWSYEAFDAQFHRIIRGG